jgi:hypothetical protein
LCAHTTSQHLNFRLPCKMEHGTTQMHTLQDPERYGMSKEEQSSPHSIQTRALERILFSNPFSSPGHYQPSVLPTARNCERIWIQRHANGRGCTTTSEHVLLRWHANGRGCACTSTRCPSPPFIRLVYLLLWPMCAMVKKVLGHSHPHRGGYCVCLGGCLGPYCRSTKWQTWSGIWRINIQEYTPEGGRVL